MWFDQSSDVFPSRRSYFSPSLKRFTMNLITAIFNIITAPVAVIIKALVVTAVFSFSPLSTPSNQLIGCLALSDVLVA